MNTSSAPFAPASAPDTAASTIVAPLSATVFAVCCVSQGSLEEVSSSAASRRRPWTRPSSPSATVCTACPFGSIVITMSLASATSRGVRAARTGPPRACASCFAADGFASSSVRLCPARAR